MAIQPTAKNTKAEILKAYKELAEEHKDLEGRFEKIQKEKKASDQKVIEILEQTRAEEPQEDAAGEEEQMDERSLAPAPSSISRMVENLSGLQSGFGSAINEFSERLIAEAQKLQNLRSEIKEEEQRLKTLHGLEIADDTLENLLQEYLDKSKSYRQELQQKRDNFELEMQEKKSAWQKEKDDHARLIKERNELAGEASRREAEEYKYNLELHRKLDEAEYERRQKMLKKELERLEESRKQEWDERERRIAEQERELNGYRERVESYPADLEAAIKKSKEEAAARARQEVKSKADLRAKEVEGEQRVYNLEIQSLEDTLEKQVQQIEELSAKLDAVLKQAQDLAVKAIEGASSTGSFQAVKEIALEQAKTLQKNK